MERRLGYAKVTTPASRLGGHPKSRGSQAVRHRGEPIRGTRRRPPRRPGADRYGTRTRTHPTVASPSAGTSFALGTVRQKCRYGTGAPQSLTTNELCQGGRLRERRRTPHRPRRDVCRLRPAGGGWIVHRTSGEGRRTKPRHSSVGDFVRSGREVEQGTAR